ncbi:MAG: inositol monophosphatase family protein [Polyangiaceae bacterium]
MSFTHPLLEPIRELHDVIAAGVIAACHGQNVDDLARVAEDGEGDTIYAVDRVSEELLVRELERCAERVGGVVLIAEGIAGGQLTLPGGWDSSRCRYRVIVDPIDGTRGFMYQKRPAWVLTGVAPNLGPETRLSHIELAVQTELPLVKQRLSDQLLAVRGAGVRGERIDLQSGAREPLTLRPSRATSLEHSFATFCRFFPGARDVLAAIDDELMFLLMGKPGAKKALCFEDQYTSTGGQFYELMAGHESLRGGSAPAAGAADARARAAAALVLPSLRRRGCADRGGAGRVPAQPVGRAARRAARFGRGRGLGRLRKPRADAPHRAATRRGVVAPRLFAGRPMNFEVERVERAHFSRLLQLVTASNGELAGFFESHAPGGASARASAARRDGRHRRLLGLAGARAAAGRGGLRGRAASPRSRTLDRQRRSTAAARCASAAPADRAFLQASYADAQRLLHAEGIPDWAPYVAGVVLPLLRDKGFELSGGVRIAIASRVPEGKGVSSSAAIEVAAWFALSTVAELPIDAREAAMLCQRVENRVVGAPCGVMDQMTSACGRRAELLELLCQPATLLGSRPVPHGLGFFGIDSGVRHAVSGADYGQVRVAAFMGYRILAERLGFVTTQRPGEALAISDPRFLGYLANISPSQLDSQFYELLPVRLSGAEFLERFAGISDAVTKVEPRVVYPVRAATAHPIREHHRVRSFAELLGTTVSERMAELLGELMYQSHHSYSACGLGSEATDRLVELVREAGPRAGFYGAKITGGGSGGTVAVLARADAEANLFELAQRFAQESRAEARVFSGSSAGAAQFGAVLVSGATLAAPA